ncbi:hypothetical protein [Caenimonas aquaedulcis]|uniref:Transmembrane protein n=1 Tax=Caenimonas aquaedulcis TaxID=2793270 RepID=A0A931H7N3_9BURK|nr:hypothetical protein [Caenimonas aquaedulcis]MBG9390194.1 hypothetical protein [Caenimonas aquaedulcis]
MSMWRGQWMRIAWPGFLAACLLELLVFALVDPGELRWSGDLPSRQGVYTLAFFLFWAIATVACALTVLLGTPAEPAGEQVGD